MGYKTAITDFSFFILTPKIKKKLFFKNIILKVPISFPKFRKKVGINVAVLIVCYLHAKFELNNLIFDRVIAKKKLLKIDDVKNSNSIFCRC